MERDAPLLEVREFMSAHPMALRADQPIDEALALLDEHGWTGAPVVDGDGHVVGVFSEIDGLRVLSNAAYHTLPPGSVADHMTPDPLTIHPHADVYAVAHLLRTKGFRRLPVCEDGKLVGLVTARDVALALRRIQAAREALHDTPKPPGASWDPRASAERDRKREG